MTDFEKAFDKFLDDPVHDETNDAIFRLTRRAFVRGWVAAGGDEPASREILQIKEFMDEE